MDARAEFGTAQAIAVVRIVSSTPIVSVVRPLSLPRFKVPALASVLSISGHSISAVAPDHIPTRGVGAWAIAA